MQGREEEHSHPGALGRADHTAALGNRCDLEMAAKELVHHRLEKLVEVRGL